MIILHDARQFYLLPAEVEVLKTLIEFHWSNDELGHGYYDEIAFNELVTKLFPELTKPA